MCLCVCCVLCRKPPFPIQATRSVLKYSTDAWWTDTAHAAAAAAIANTYVCLSVVFTSSKRKWNQMKNDDTAVRPTKKKTQRETTNEKNVSDDYKSRIPAGDDYENRCFFRQFSFSLRLSHSLSLTHCVCGCPVIVVCRTVVSSLSLSHSFPVAH